MTWHNTIGIEYQTFVFTAVCYAISQCLEISFPCEDIDPIHGCERNEIGRCWIMKLIFSAHRLKIAYSTVKKLQFQIKLSGAAL